MNWKEIKETKIYALECPITGEIKYIGRTVHSLNTRLSQHINDSKRYKNKCANWIKFLLKKDLKPKIILIEIARGNGFEEEIFYISYFKFLGCNLKNHSGGGESGSFGYHHTEEAKEKIRKANLGKTISNYAREQVRRANTGKIMTNKSKSKISKANSGRKRSQEVRTRISNSLKGRTLGVDWLVKVNEAKYIPIIQYDKSGRYICLWKGAKTAGEGLNISRSAINNNLKGITKTAGGFVWHYSGL